jgi:MFS family permease
MPFLADASLSLVACILLGYLVPAQSTHPDEGHRWPQLGRVKALLADRRLYAFALFCSVNNIAFPVLSAFVPVKARQLWGDPRQISLMLSLEAVSFSLASWLIGRASDRWGRRIFVVAAQPGVILACVGLVLAPSWPMMAICYALFGLAGGTTCLLGLVMAADVIPPVNASQALGAFDAAVDLLISAPALAMLAHRQLGRIAPLFLIVGLPAWLAWPVALRMGETRADRSASSQGIE